MRPCECGNVTPGQAWQKGECRKCWHWEHTPQMRAAWGGNPNDCTPVASRTIPPAGGPGPCVYRGEPTGGLATCNTCTGRVQLKVHECEKHGRCVLDKAAAGVKSCKTCGDYAERVPTVDDLVNALRSPRPIPNGGNYHPNQTAAVHRIVDDLRTDLPPLPTFAHKRGIVTSGGGKYWPGAWVQAYILRKLGWRHPIQVWFLGDRERSDIWAARFASLEVRCIDAEQVRKQHPYRILNGFEVKLYAVMHSRIEQPLWLDSDCYPCRNPEVLYECPGYQRTGSVHYPDMANSDSWTRWERWGVARDDSPPIETGQYLYNLPQVWEEANIALKLNELSDVTYHWDYGDKGPARAAWAWTRRERTIYQRVPQWSGPAFIHPGHDGKPLFVHRCRGKVAHVAKFYTPQNSNGLQYHKTLPAEELFQKFAKQARDMGDK